MKKGIFQSLVFGSLLMGGAPEIKIKTPSRPKNFKKNLDEYRTPPRSMTPAEKDYYDLHKTLSGFYS